MLDYQFLRRTARDGLLDLGDAEQFRQISFYLIDEWVEDYGRIASIDGIVETTLDRYRYLFDVAAGRLVAAWGLSPGATGQIRDKARMAGHPIGGPTGYHRGHAIPNQLGGGTDINLVPQWGSLNVGPFRILEMRAVDSPGSLYFTYWIYSAEADQRPFWVQQGLLRPQARDLEASIFAN